MRNLIYLALIACVSATAFERLPFKCIELNVTVDREAIKRSGLHPSKVVNVLRKAAREWNKESPVKIRIVKSGGNITVVPFNIQKLYGAFVPLEFSGSVVTRAEIRINALKLHNQSRMIYPVLLHELGHALGLAHSPVPEATMYPLIGEETKKLHIDDVLGVRQ